MQIVIDSVGITNIPFLKSERMPNQSDRNQYQQAAAYPPSYQNQPQQMSGPFQQPGYNPQYANPYPGQAPPPAGWAPGGQQQQQQQGGFVPPPPMAMPRPGAEHYMEGGQADKYAFNFSDATIRAGFVRKVFALVTVMLAVVAVMTALPFLHPGIRNTVRTNIGLYWASYATFMVVYLVLICCESVRRSFPVNMIMTGIFTLATGYMTMMITAHHDISSVLMCLIICTVCCGAIIIFSSQTKYDLTNLMGIMFILSMVLFVYGLVAMVATIWFKVKFLYTIYAALAAVMFMFYLAIDVQMIMGGRKYEISPEDHIFAAIQIFLDIIYIFWMLLSLFGGSSNRN